MKKKTTNGNWGRAILSGITTFAVLILLGFAAVLVVVPKLCGGMSLTVLTGSMEPGINPGDVAVTRGIDIVSASELKIGDVIAFLPYADNSMMVTHRIIARSVGQEGVGFVTKGDNNNAEDPWNPVSDKQIRGKVMYVIPKIGYVKQWLGSSTAWLIPGIAVVLIGYAVISFTSSFRQPKQTSDDLPTQVEPDHPATSGSRFLPATEEPFDDGWDDDAVPTAPRHAL